MRNASLTSAMLLPLVILSLGCQRSVPATVSAKPNQATTAGPRHTATSSQRLDNDSYKSANELEMEKFGQQVVSAVVGQDIDHLEKLIDWQYILNLSTETIDSSSELKSLYLESVDSVSLQPILRTFLSTVANGGSFAFLAARDLNGQKSALFRIIQPTGSLNYCDMRVGKSGDGTLRCTDLRVFTIGEYLSETFRHDFRLLVAKYEAGKSTPEFDAYLKHTDDLSEIARTARKGDGTRACELIEKLPSVLQTNRRVLIMKIRACENQGDEVWLSAINEFSDRFPHDPTTKLLAIQANILMGQHDTALQLLKELDESIGGDPYLGALRADQYFLQGDIQTAKEIAIEVIEEEQGLHLAYWTLARAAAEEGMFVDAVRWLDKLYGPEVPTEAIEEALHDYSKLLDSPEFRQWKEHRSVGQ